MCWPNTSAVAGAEDNWSAAELWSLVISDHKAVWGPTGILNRAALLGKLWFGELGVELRTQFSKGPWGRYGGGKVLLRAVPMILLLQVTCVEASKPQPL